ncbi:MAG: Fis family transcriptional regulator, partial [Deltaproteobacteria bacterium]|nr:Fis family transcriptional regulator [Deltaproteobacteria bacterium]
DDFFYRLQVIPITLPPLREHKEDIPLLVDHFLRINGNSKKPVIPSKIMEALMNYGWPGNVRELQNVLHRYLTFKRLDLIEMGNPKLASSHNGSTEQFAKDLILKVLQSNQWHKAKAASMLGLPRRTFFRKLKYLGLT